MAYFPPRFNLWCQVWRLLDPLDPFAYTMVGYSRCQLRGPSPYVAEPQSVCEVLFPKYSDIRGPQQSEAHNIGDTIVLAGYDKWRHWRVFFVCDKGAGFPNEYRMAICATFRPVDVGDGHGALPVVNPELAPPDGFLPLPLLPIIDTWPIDVV